MRPKLSVDPPSDAIADEYRSQSRQGIEGRDITFGPHVVMSLLNERAILLQALKLIAELEGDDERQEFKLTRFQASQIARAAIYHTRGV